jgi:hypothetical protein
MKKNNTGIIVDRGSLLTVCRFFVIVALACLLPFKTFSQWRDHADGIYFNGNVAIGKFPTEDFALDILGNVSISGALNVNQIKFTDRFELGSSETSLIKGLYSGGRNILAVNCDLDDEEIESSGATFLLKGPAHFSVDNGEDDFAEISEIHLADFNVWVEGGIISNEIAIAATNKWADYVFDESYNLMPLDSVEEFIDTHDHLPGIPSAEEIKAQGFYSANDLAMKLLEKVEELTLYTIEQDKEIRRLLQELEKYRSVIAANGTSIKN